MNQLCSHRHAPICNLTWINFVRLKPRQILTPCDVCFVKLDKEGERLVKELSWALVVISSAQSGISIISCSWIWTKFHMGNHTRCKTRYLLLYHKHNSQVFFAWLFSMVDNLLLLNNSWKKIYALLRTVLSKLKPV